MAPSFSGVWKLQTKYQYNSAFPVDTNLLPKTLIAGGYTGADAFTNVVAQINISNTANATDYGDLTLARSNFAGGGSDTRAVFAGGYGNSFSTYSDVIDYKAFSSSGNLSDFGNLSVGRAEVHTIGNSNTRLIFAGGYTGSNSDVIDYITIASTGNATDFGNLSAATYRTGNGVVSSETRGVTMGRSGANEIQFITIASVGNSRDFGDLSVNRYQVGQLSSSTRGIAGGGYTVSDGSNSNVIDFIGLASMANATDFGDLTVARYRIAGASSPTRGIFAGGTTSTTDVIDYVTIASTGNALDFGDLTHTVQVATAASAEHPSVQPNVLPSLPSAGNTGLYTYAVDSFLQSIDIASLGNGVAFGDISYKYVNGSYGAASSSTRCCFAGGYVSGGVSPSIDLTIFATRGLGTDFGDLTVARRTTGGSNETRGMYLGGQPSGYTNVVDYTTIASASNATDFGDLSENVGFPAVSGNTTRLLSLGGRTSGYRNVIEYFTISSTGDATDFGDLTQNVGFGAATSSSTRVVNCGGYATSAYTDVIDYVTTASTGNATDFGDLTVAIGQGGCFGNKTTAIWAGGYVGDGSSTVSTMMNFTIASTGNASNFGDLVASAYTTGAAQSNGHGGIS